MKSIPKFDPCCEVLILAGDRDNYIYLATKYLWIM